MNKIIIYLFAISILTACKNKSFIHHKLKFEKISDNCSDGQQSFQMNSNLNGERYEFNKCLQNDFTKEQVNITRHEDTIVVNFSRSLNNKKQFEFHIILDIDAFPRYNFLTIDGDTFIIVPASG